MSPSGSNDYYIIIPKIDITLQSSSININDTNINFQENNKHIFQLSDVVDTGYVE